ncbi:hypothetical protein F2Q70_00031335 [Brassica cretica]|nr:hypothetical protein F2Q70_00031335 [Brassica cretica]
MNTKYGFVWAHSGSGHYRFAWLGDMLLLAGLATATTFMSMFYHSKCDIKDFKLVYPSRSVPYRGELIVERVTSGLSRAGCGLQNVGPNPVKGIQCKVKRPELNEGEANHYSFEKVTKLRKEMSVVHSSSLASHIVDLKMILCVKGIQCMVKRPELNEGEANRYSFEKVTKLRKEMSVEHSSSLASHIVHLKMILCTKKVLVDSLADLPCLSYHFDNEIEEVSKHAFERREDLIANENDLHTVSIIFRVFRTYGDYVLSDHLKPLATGCRACPPHILKYAKSSPHISVPEQPSSGCKGQYYLL